MSPYVTILKSFFRSLRLFFLPVWENKLIKDNEMKVKGKKKLMHGSPFCDETWTLDSSRPDWKK